MSNTKKSFHGSLKVTCTNRSTLYGGGFRVANYWSTSKVSKSRDHASLSMRCGCLAGMRNSLRVATSVTALIRSHCDVGHETSRLWKTLGRGVEGRNAERLNPSPRCREICGRVAGSRAGLGSPVIVKKNLAIFSSISRTVNQLTIKIWSGRIAYR